MILELQRNNPLLTYLEISVLIWLDDSEFMALSNALKMNTYVEKLLLSNRAPSFLGNEIFFNGIAENKSIKKLVLECDFYMLFSSLYPSVGEINKDKFIKMLELNASIVSLTIDRKTESVVQKRFDALGINKKHIASTEGLEETFAPYIERNQLLLLWEAYKNLILFPSLLQDIQNLILSFIIPDLNQGDVTSFYKNKHNPVTFWKFIDSRKKDEVVLSAPSENFRSSLNYST